MPSNVRQLLDNGVPVYPITDKSLVIGLQDVPFESYVVAWDGASTPVPANIPAGVVVTYNTTDYTGTLAAGSATAPYLYLVASASQQGEYDRYIVTHTGSTYAWTQLGSTAPVSPVIADDLTTNDSSKALSAKQGKILGEEVGELEAKVTDLDDAVELTPGVNIYDGNGTIDGQYKRGCVVKLIPSRGENFVLSTKGPYPDYFFSFKYILSDNTEIDASYTGSAYSPGNVRAGRVFTPPSNAVKFSFTYRFAYSGGTLVSEVMVTYGNTIGSNYFPYEVYGGFKNPIYTPYTDEANGAVYVAPSGVDSNEGTFESPFASLERAIVENKRIVMRGGLYEQNTQLVIKDLRYHRLDIRAYNGEEPIIFRGAKIATSAELMVGSTKVYVMTADAPGTMYLFQYGIADESTLINDSERTPYHRGRVYRNPYSTVIRKTTSVENIEASSSYLFYYDEGEGKLYFSCPAPLSSGNFLYKNSTNLFYVVDTDWELHLKGITLVGGSINPTGSRDTTLEDCKVIGARNTGGFILDIVKNCHIVKCEAAFVEPGIGSAESTGDGFNAHSEDYPTDFTMTDCWSHDNNNDGYSDHEKSSVVIDGGLFEHNCISGYGAGLTPAYGANDVIRNVISQHNNATGILYSGLQSSVRCGMVLFGCIVRNNAGSGVVSSGNVKVEVANCVIYGNGHYGVKGTSGNPVVMMNSISSGNTDADADVTIIG